jgi:hypothetical protein
MTTTDNFDLEGYLKDFGRLEYVRPRLPRPTLTLKPGKPPEGEKGVDEFARVIYPGALLDSIFPTDIPETMLPMIVGPSFEWQRGVRKQTVAKMIIESDLVYDERATDITSLTDLGWYRLHAAYLVNQIDPGREISVWEQSSGAGASSHEEPRDKAPEEIADFFTDLLADDDPFADDAFGFDFESGDDQETEGFARRTVAVTDWLAELMPIARAHFSFYTNSLVIAKKLFGSCTPTRDLSAFLSLLKEKPRKTAERYIKWGENNVHVYHAHSYRYLAALAESTPHQRTELFDQMVTVERVNDVRATLGDDVVAGYVFGSESSTLRRNHTTFDYIVALILYGLLAVDVERRTLEITEAGWKAVEILRKCPHIDGYECVIVDMSAGVSPFSAATALEGWVLNFFGTLHSVIEQQDSPEVQR